MPCHHVDAVGELVERVQQDGRLRHRLLLHAHPREQSVITINKEQSVITHNYDVFTNFMIPELRDLSYEERLEECDLTTLVTRRLRGDQIEVFKILNGYENIDRNMFFSLKKDNRTREHEVKLVKDQCRLDIRKHSFSQRTINEWNKLSTDCVTASSVNV